MKATYGTSHSERLFGDFYKDDIIYGRGGDDLIADRVGEVSNDRYYGGRGADTLLSHGGSDFLSGGEGDDYFEFEQTDSNITVHGDHGNDVLYVSRGMFADGELDRLLGDPTQHLVLSLVNGGTLEVSGLEEVWLASRENAAIGWHH